MNKRNLPLRVGWGLFLMLFGLLSRTALAEEPAHRLFLSCPTKCFDDYVRQELSYFDFVRDPHLADHVVLVVMQPTASGGQRWTISLVPRGASPESAPRTSFGVPPATAAEDLRARIVQKTLALLHDALRTTRHVEAFALSVPRRQGGVLSRLEDPWDYWVIAPEFRIEGSAGSGYTWLDGTGTLTVRRITEMHKLRLRGSYLRGLRVFDLEERTEYGDVYGVESQALYAYSLGRHWGLGAIATQFTSQYENVRLHLRGGPLLEYNLFPYEENTTKQLRFAYQAGPFQNFYFEENTDRLLEETRAYHALSVVLDFNRSFGSAQVVVQANSLLDEPARFRISSGAVLNLRLVEGFSLNFEGVAVYLEDQLSLRARALRDEEVLLFTAQQPTSFFVEFKGGLSYTFGSVHNTIVNPRFGRVDVAED